MDNSNPYTPPASKIKAVQHGVATSTRILLLFLVAAQLIVTLLLTPESLQLVQHGDISPIAFLCVVLATGAHFIAGILLLFNRRPTKPFIVAAAIGLITSALWQQTAVFTGFSIAAIGASVFFLAGKHAQPEA